MTIPVQNLVAVNAALTEIVNFRAGLQVVWCFFIKPSRILMRSQHVIISVFAGTDVDSLRMKATLDFFFSKTQESCASLN